MRQFDVCELRDDRDTLVIILQHDVTDELGTRIVAPLSGTPYRRLIANVRVPLEFEEKPLVLQLDRMAAINKRAIGNIRGNVAHEGLRIKTALDLLFLEVRLADLINLRHARKAKDRAEREQAANEKRRLFGRTKAERQTEVTDRDRNERAIEGHRRDRDGEKT